MGPMGPRDLGPWALWAPGALGPNYENFANFKILQKLLLRTSNDPWDTSWMVLKKFEISQFFGICWVRAVCPTTRLRKAIG